VKPITLTLLMLAVVLLVLASARGSGEAAPGATTVLEPLSPQESPGVWHQVREGDTLRSISRSYYGTARNWRVIQLANEVEVPLPQGRALWIPAYREELEALHAATFGE